MLESIQPVAQIYALNTRMYEQGVEGVDDQSLRRRPADGNNPLLWIAGHLASTRFGVCQILGVNREIPWGKTFFRGASVDPAALPAMEGIRESWREISGLLQQRLEAVSEAELAAPAPKRFPIPDTTVRGAVTFLGWHEGYHIGQMSFVRRWLGLPGLAG